MNREQATWFQNNRSPRSNNQRNTDNSLNFLKEKIEDTACQNLQDEVKVVLRMKLIECDR